MECDFFHSKLHFAGFNLDSCFVKGYNQRLVNSKEFLQCVCTGSHVISEHSYAVAVLCWQVLIHGVVKRRLLDLTCGTTSHGQSTPGEDSFVSLEGHQFLGLLVKRNCPESVHSVQLKEEPFAVKLFDFVRG